MLSIYDGTYCSSKNTDRSLQTGASKKSADRSLIVFEVAMTSGGIRRDSIGQNYEKQTIIEVLREELSRLVEEKGSFLIKKS
jgi:hypothetical protein